MTTIQGGIYKLVDNSTIMLEALGYTTSGLANTNTTSYKNQRFETFLGPERVMQGTVRIDASPGDLISTTRQLDVGIEGHGYIPITNQKGETLYTRDGEFSINSEGYLVTKSNCLVGSGIKIPTTYERIKIKPDGTVTIQPEKNAHFQKIGKIPIVMFQSPEGLEYIEGNMVKETAESGKPELLMSHTKIHQGKLERSNVSQYALINDTIKINGSIISSIRTIKIFDEIYRESVNLRQ